ncbi:MAG: hypothetical protein ACKVQR_07750 [Aquabacterium sp.]
MPNCVIHPASRSAGRVNGVEVCQRCTDQIALAVRAVDRHVVPRACFVWYANASTGWQPITGTGCAHWLAHHEQIRRSRGAGTCMCGNPIRVRDVIGSRARVRSLSGVRAGDFYVSASRDHIGLVTRVQADRAHPDTPRIWIRHDSSRRGRLSVDEFAGYFESRGYFVR